MRDTRWFGVVILLFGILILFLGGWEPGAFLSLSAGSSDIGLWNTILLSENEDGKVFSVFTVIGRVNCLFVEDYCVGFQQNSMFIDIPALRYPALGLGIMTIYYGIKTLIMGNDS